MQRNRKTSREPRRYVIPSLVQYHSFDRMDKIVSEASERQGSTKCKQALHTLDIEQLIAQERDDVLRASMRELVTSAKQRKKGGSIILAMLSKLPEEKTDRVKQIQLELAKLERCPIRVRSEVDREKTIARNRAFKGFAKEFMFKHVTFERASELLDRCATTGRLREDVQELDQRLKREFLRGHPQFADSALSAKNGRWANRPSMHSLLKERVENESSWRSLVDAADAVTTEASRMGDQDRAALLESNEFSETAGVVQNRIEPPSRIDRASLGEESALIGETLSAEEIIADDGAGATSGCHDDDNCKVRCLAAECLRMPLLCLRPDCAVWLQENSKNDTEMDVDQIPLDPIRHNRRGSDPVGEGYATDHNALATDDNALTPVPAPAPAPLSAPPSSLSCPPLTPVPSSPAQYRCRPAQYQCNRPLSLCCPPPAPPPFPPRPATLRPARVLFFTRPPPPRPAGPPLSGFRAHAVDWQVDFGPAGAMMLDTNSVDAPGWPVLGETDWVRCIAIVHAHAAMSEIRLCHFCDCRTLTVPFL